MLSAIVLAHTRVRVLDGIALALVCAFIPSKCQGRDSFHMSLIKRGPEGIPPAPRLEIDSAIVHAPHAFREVIDLTTFRLGRNKISGSIEPGRETHHREADKQRPTSDNRIGNRATLS